MFGFFRSTPPPQKAAAGMSAKPLAVAQPPVGPAAIGIDKIEHAKYRLDAIKRTIEQNPNLPVQHRAEFKAEIRDCVHLLAKAGIITDMEAAAQVAAGTGVTL